MKRPLQEYYTALQPVSIAEVKERAVRLKQGMDLYEDLLATRPQASYLSSSTSNSTWAPPSSVRHGSRYLAIPGS